jgi:hypothetical protein
MLQPMNLETLASPSAAQTLSAHDDAVLLANQPAVVLPLDPTHGLSEERRDLLDQRAQGLIAKYGDQSMFVTRGTPARLRATPVSSRALPVLDYRDVGNILNDIANDNQLSEPDRAYVWTKIADHKLTSTRDRDGALYFAATEGARPAVIDSNQAFDSPGHAFVGFADRYHGRMAMMSEAQAIATIRDHENNEGGLAGRILRKTPAWHYNTGDFSASMRTVEALRAYRAGGFAAFAATWNRLFVER